MLFNHLHSFTSDIKNTTVDTNQEFKQILFHVEFKELKIFDIAIFSGRYLQK